RSRSGYRKAKKQIQRLWRDKKGRVLEKRLKSIIPFKDDNILVDNQGKVRYGK
ncbi:hypothetical protein LCGC14_2035510, partial [marine sediment metagenome]